MHPKKLYERTIKTCVADCSDPYDFPEIISGSQAEEYAYDHDGHIAAHPGVLKLYLSRQDLLYDKGHTIIGGNSHVCYNVKRYTQSCKQTANYQK